MSDTQKTLLFCELETNAEIGSWPQYQQWLSQAPHHGLRVEQARFQPDLAEQLERADAMFICSPDALCPEMSYQISQGKRTIASFCHGTSDDRVRAFWSTLGLEITNRGIFPLDPPPEFDHPQSLFLKTDYQGNSMASALLDGTDEHEFSSADRIDCTEDWSPAFVLPSESYCDYIRGQDKFDFFPETGDPFFAASRCFKGEETSLFFSTNAFMADGLTTNGDYAASGYREHRNLSNRLLKWLAGDLSVSERKTERIRAMWFRFETLLHRKIDEVMSEAFGHHWPSEHLPDELNRKVQRENLTHGSGARANSHFHFVDYSTIIRHHWNLFSSKWPWIEEISKTQLKRNFSSLNHKVRRPCAHPARLGDAQIPEEDERLLKSYFSKIKTC